MLFLFAIAESSKIFSADFKFKDVKSSLKFSIGTRHIRKNTVAKKRLEKKTPGQSDHFLNLIDTNSYYASN